MNKKELCQLIYLKMIDELDDEHYAVPEGLNVTNAYEEGSVCDKAYSVVYDLHQKIVDEMSALYENCADPEQKEVYKSLCRKYDRYLDRITGEMTRIQDDLAARMYLYGKRAYALGLDTDVES